MADLEELRRRLEALEELDRARPPAGDETGYDEPAGAYEDLPEDPEPSPASEDRMLLGWGCVALAGVCLDDSRILAAGLLGAVWLLCRAFEAERGLARRYAAVAGRVAVLEDVLRRKASERGSGRTSKLHEKVRQIRIILRSLTGG